MASVNKVILIGNLTKDPEVRYLPSGKGVCNFSVATNETWKDSEGKKVDHAEFHNISVFDKLAEICGQYLKKGAPAYLEGRLRTRKWQDKSGNDRYTTEIIADKVQFLGTVEKSEAKVPSRDPQKTPMEQLTGMDDDIPF